MSLCAALAVPVSAAASISLSASSAAVGTPITVTASGFAADSYLTCYFLGEQVTTAPATVKTDSTGAATFSFAVPEATYGAHTNAVKVTDGVNNAYANFTVQSTVKISPTSGPKGSSATVSATGFAGGVSLDVYAGITDADASGTVGDSVTDVLSGTLVGTGSTDEKGSATITCTMNAQGTVSALDGAGNIANNMASFSFIPGITVDPTSGPVGSTVTIDGSGFTAGTTITQITFAGNVVTPTFVAITGETYTGGNATGGEVSTTGKFRARIAVPAGQSAGTKQVKATASDTKSATTTFDVTAASVTLDPTEGVTGTWVTVTGSGFNPSTTTTTVTLASLTFTDYAKSAFNVLPSGGVTIGSDGSFVCQITIPGSAAAGAGTLTATDSLGAVGKASFTVIGPSISLSPTSGPAGTVVTVTGTGFPAYSTLSSLTIGTANVTPIPSVITDALGNFTATFVVPAIGTGVATVTATVGTAAPQTANFTITAAAVSVSTGLKSIEGKYTKVWGFDATTQSWKLYDVSAPEVSDLASLEQGKGYWIQVTEDCTLIYGGHTYDLKAGWNLIGWLG